MAMAADVEVRRAAAGRVSDRTGSCDLVVVGASAGGVAALIELVHALPANLGAAVVVVLHLPTGGRSVLASILGRSGTLPVSTVRDAEPLRPGHIYVAPPDHHTVVEDGHLRLVLGPKENGHRPSIDPLFRSAASSYGPRVAGVVLSGMLDDGTAGLREVKRAGGLAFVQDPDEATYSSMAKSAIANVEVDEIAPLATIAKLLGSLTSGRGREARSAGMNEMSDEGRALAIEEATERYGAPSGFTCPECGGAIWEIDDGALVRFRCHVGHAYSMESFLSAQSADVEAVVWSAVRALREKASISRRMAGRLDVRDLESAARRMRAVADESERYAALLEQGLRARTLDAGIDEPNSEVG
jgi:two-component system chemotaxis response regulator CheB